jgi:hypothetical protein
MLAAANQVSRSESSYLNRGFGRRIALLNVPERKEPIASQASAYPALCLLRLSYSAVIPFSS